MEDILQREREKGDLKMTKLKKEKKSKVKIVKKSRVKRNVRA